MPDRARRPARQPAEADNPAFTDRGDPGGVGSGDDPVRHGAGGGGAGHARDPRRRGHHRQGDRGCSRRRPPTAPTLVVLPECFVSLYPSGAWARGGRDLGRRLRRAVGADVGVERRRRRAARRPPRRGLRRARRVTSPSASTSARTTGRARCTTRCCVIGPEGVLHRHRKLMPTMHERVFHGVGAGDDLGVVDVPGVGRVGGLICWENRMPLAALGRVPGRSADLARAERRRQRRLDRVDAPHRDRGRGVRGQRRRSSSRPPRSRPTSRSPLPDGDEVFGRGGACIVSPAGDLIAGPLYDAEGVVVADCDLREALHAKRYFDVVGHYGRADVLAPASPPPPPRPTPTTDHPHPHSVLRTHCVARRRFPHGERMGGVGGVSLRSGRGRFG